MIESILRALERVIPRRTYRFFQPAYHYALTLLGAIRYGFPSRHLTVIFVTGTKGKSSTAEILNAILEAAGKKTALLGTIRFKVGSESKRNLRKMTIPGRFFVQKFLRDAVSAGCTHAVIEMTSEGAKQHRHRFIAQDALIFTNLAPEHIESHGSYEKYRDAKLSIARALGTSKKPGRFMVANADDTEGALFLEIPGVEPIPYRMEDAIDPDIGERHIRMTFRGERLESPLGGAFNAMNILGAATCAAELGIPLSAIASGVAALDRIPGRMEFVDAGQGFPVVVDYAHTPDSLTALYDAFQGHTRVCVLGSTGGGRDKWKRKVMGEVADKNCSHIILTDEDPYDEDPGAIVAGLREGIHKHEPEIIMNRREAIARGIAISRATTNAALLITGKGTDPFIMGPRGTKTPWDDRDVAKEELSIVVDS
jgi:UDP-N-acetylmuramoyl-L-alanyl-D-glutamate--2,6-diaminopimelate ligase